MNRYMNRYIKILLDTQIKKAYYRKPINGWMLPAYFEFFNYTLSIYAMNMDWESLRIKLEKDKHEETETTYVIKKGKY